MELCVDGIRDSGTFGSKAEAREWAVRREVELREQGRNPATAHTVGDMFDRYAKDVSSLKRGERWERLRLDAAANIQVLGRRFGGWRVSDITPAHIAAYRDQRLRTVSGSTVNREMNILSHVFSVAKDEWGWIKESPTRAVSRPKSSPPRDRLIDDDEIDRICFALGFDGVTTETVSQRVAVAFLFAIETAMRCGEICGLRRVSVTGPVALLPKTKNGQARRVPLSKRALELLALLPDSGPEYFGITTAQVDALFRKARARAGCDDVHFHDTRHLAITRLAQKLSVLELARMVGHKNLKMLQIYYNESAEALAKKLD